MLKYEKKYFKLATAAIFSPQIDPPTPPVQICVYAKKPASNRRVSEFDECQMQPNRAGDAEPL